MVTLIETLDNMLHEHKRGIEQDRIDSRVPTGKQYCISHGTSTPSAPSIPSQPIRAHDGLAPLKPVHLTNPDIIRSYNANRILGDGDNAYVEQKGITWSELEQRRYERHARY